MTSTFKLGRIFGIEIGLHYSWFLIALLITFSLATQFGETNPQWGPSIIWTTAILTALFFFAALVAHEMSHALMARRFGIDTRAITLFALGGVAQIESEPKEARTEFWVGIIGPITSAIIGVVCLVIAFASGWTGAQIPNRPAVAMLVWLGYINLMLAIFNLVPGYPLDGGRILRSLIWWKTKDVVRATRLASRVGQFIAICFIALGIIRFFTGQGFPGLWIAFIGWFLLQASQASYAQIKLADGLKGVRVQDIMSRDCASVDSRSNVKMFVEEHLLRSGRRCYVVERDGHLVGLVTPHEVKSIAPEKWPYTTMDDVMRPLDQLHTVQPETSVIEALETMGKDDENQLPVVPGNRLEGVISRANVLQFLQTRAELGR
jgi:Zn-dependent protease/CBS domain-containing protein